MRKKCEGSFALLKCDSRLTGHLQTAEERGDQDPHLVKAEPRQDRDQDPHLVKSRL